MQVFVVFTGSEFWGNKTKDIYLFMTELPGDSYCFISPSLGVTCGLSNNLVPRVEREQGWLSIPKLINNSRRENKNKQIITVTKVEKN